MSIKSEEFLTSVESMVGNQKSLEIDLRNAVSRAYYSAYHACRSEVGVVNKYKDMGAHACLIKTMGEHRNEKIRSLGLQLEKCKKKRHKADYLLEQSVLPGEAEQVLIQCKLICEAIVRRQSSGLAIVK